MIKSKQEAVRRAHRAMSQKKTELSTFYFEKTKKELNDAYKQELKSYVDTKINIINNALEHQRSRLAWEAVNEITGRKNTPTGKIKAKNPEERLEKWKDNFFRLLGQPPAITEQETIKVVQETLPINTNDFTKDELQKCIKSFSNGKASGLDDILIEVWKTKGLLDPLLDVCNITYYGDKPKIWAKSGLVPFPKKGDLGNTNNYPLFP